MVTLTKAEQDFMTKRFFASLTVISPNTGMPYSTTVWLHWHPKDEKFYMITNKATKKWKFFEAGSKKVAINVTDPKGWPFITMNGEVNIHFEKDRDDFWEIITDVITKYNPNDEAIKNWKNKMQTAPPNAERMLLELEPKSFRSTVS